MGDEVFMRNILIEGKKDQPHGFALAIRNADTGEVIPGVLAVRLNLGPGNANVAHVSYYATDATGNIVIGADGLPVTHFVAIEDPTVADLAALESSRQKIGSYDVVVRPDTHGIYIEIEDEARNGIGLDAADALALHAYLGRIHGDLMKWVKPAEATS